MTSSASPELANEAVNGKIDLGTRKLKASYVENATTLYAYLETEFHALQEMTESINEAYKTATAVLGPEKIRENDIYLVYSDKDRCAARARIEQSKAGPGSKVRARFDRPWPG